jgi:hypothetical protein
MTSPTPGTRFTVTGQRGILPNVYELVGEQPDVDPIYRYVLRLVSFDERHSKALKVGDVILVERSWFDVRGEMAAKSEGAVRRTA